MTATPAKAGTVVEEAGKGFQASDLALIAVFAALMAVFALIPPIFTVGAIPFSLAMIIVLLAPLVLGSIRGGASMALYILVGVAGLPVFAGGASGPAKLIGPSGGYLVGYIACGLICGAIMTALVRRRPGRRVLPVLLCLIAVVGVGVVHVFGVAWFMVGPLHLPLGKAIATTAVFLPWDILKAVLAGLLATAVFLAYPRLMPRPRNSAK